MKVKTLNLRSCYKSSASQDKPPQHHQPEAAFHQPLTKCVEQMAPAKWRGNKAKGALGEVCV